MSPKTEYTIAFPDLRGGLNLSKEYGMDSDESPAMKYSPVHGVYGGEQLKVQSAEC